MLPRKAKQKATPAAIVFDDDEDDETFATSAEEGTSLNYDVNGDEEAEDREAELLGSDSQDEDDTDEVVEYDEEEEDDDHKGNGKGYTASTREQAALAPRTLPACSRCRRSRVHCVRSNHCECDKCRIVNKECETKLTVIELAYAADDRPGYSRNQNGILKIRTTKKPSKKPIHCSNCKRSRQQYIRAKGEVDCRICVRLGLECKRIQGKEKYERPGDEETTKVRREKFDLSPSLITTTSTSMDKVFPGVLNLVVSYDISGRAQ